MITKLNLSSNPFRNRTTPYILSSALLFLAFVGGVFLLAQWRENLRLAEVAASEADDLRKEVEIDRNQTELVQKELTPAQREMLIASHKLVANKNFGWSRLFFDLETVIPGGVSASRISVANVFENNGRPGAELDFAVLARDYQSVITMITNMNNSGIFQAELRDQNLQTNQRLKFTEFSLRLVYTPAVGVSAESSNDIARANDGGAGE
ncbi:MAG TPA: hypothetical protein DEA22_01870 [Blastocatellia bacterium]|nr:hypothetical protein [Blastocatellia bacterium]